MEELLYDKGMEAYNISRETVDGSWNAHSKIFSPGRFINRFRRFGINENLILSSSNDVLILPLAPLNNKLKRCYGSRSSTPASVDWTGTDNVALHHKIVSVAHPSCVIKTVSNIMQTNLRSHVIHKAKRHNVSPPLVTILVALGPHNGG